MSMSTGPAAAIVAESGFIWSTNGQRVVVRRRPRPTTRSSERGNPASKPRRLPWPSEAVSELIVMACASKAGFGSQNHRRSRKCAAQTPSVYPPPRPAQPFLALGTLVTALDFRGGSMTMRRASKSMRGATRAGERQQQVSPPPTGAISGAGERRPRHKFMSDTTRPTHAPAASMASSPTRSS